MAAATFVFFFAAIWNSPPPTQLSQDYARRRARCAYFFVAFFTATGFAAAFVLGALFALGAALATGFFAAGFAAFFATAFFVAM